MKNNKNRKNKHFILEILEFLLILGIITLSVLTVVDAACESIDTTAEEPTTVITEPVITTEPTTLEVVTTVEPTEVIEIKEERTGMSDYERWVVECMVMGEAGGESYEGQVLVAQCILNACELDGLTPSEVVVAFQYSGWNENPSESVKDAVSAVFDDGYKITDEPILYFYSPNLCDSEWHETQRFVIAEGSHKFFARW